MRDLSDVTPLQAEILEILWTQGSGTAATVREALAGGADLARTTVATVLGRMERHGWLSRERSGREFTYRAAVARGQVRSAQVRRMVRALFPQDLPSLVSHALRTGDWEDDDLDRIADLLQRYRDGTQPSREDEGEDGA